MQISLIFLQLAGAVMLLLYSTRMVRTGFERAAGPALRQLLLVSSGNPFKGVVTGLGVAVLLQSSLAVILLLAGFVSTGAISLSGALAIVLGADVGTAVVVQFLSLDLDWLIPVLLLVGGFLFLRVEARTAKQVGRIILGVSFILLSLGMIAVATQPLREAAQLPGIVQYLGDDRLAAIAGGALIAFLFHSSVATVLLLATLSAQSVLPLEAGLPLVLGANAGSALLALWISRGAHREARRLTMANAILRCGFALIVLLVLYQTNIVAWLPGFSLEQQLVNFHLLFNLALVVVSVPLVRPVLASTKWLTGRDVADDGLVRQTALDSNALSNPEQALASVTRELLSLSQQAETMMQQIPKLLERYHPETVQQIEATEMQINQAHTAIKLYIADLNSGPLSVDEARRGIELTSMAINIERVGDIIAKELLDRIKEMHEKRREFSAAGLREITVLHARVMVNMQMSLNVLLSEDLASAKQLVIEKNHIGALERETRARHLHRLMKGTSESIATSDLHLELIRALREINSLYTAVAYPILSKYGALLDTRIAGASKS